MLSIITLLLNVIILLTGVISSITDFKTGKIYNHLLMYSILSGSVCVLGNLILQRELIVPYMINLAAAFFLGVAFYKEKFWGAGDAKLWIVLIALFPFQQYHRTKYMVIPSIHVLMLIFVTAYCYVIVESILLAIRRKKEIHTDTQKLNWKEFILQWFFGFFVISVLSRGLQMVLKDYFYQNQMFFSVLFLLLVQWLSGRNIKKKRLLTGFLAVVFLLLEYEQQQLDIRQYMINGIIILIVLFIGRMGAKYNYRSIRTEDVEPGMVLSYMTVAEFQASRVKNLPRETDETTKSRITKEEAEAVRRWKDSKYGKDQIVVLSILPFAIFELLGMLVYMAALVMLQK